MNLDDSLDDDICIKNNDIFNYKGYFVENEDEEDEPKIYEFGAHFSYKELYKSLQELRNKQIKSQKLNKIENNKLINNKKITNRERNNTKNNNKRKDLNSIMKIFKSKGKSRNIGIVETKNDNVNEKTFEPKINSKNKLFIKKEDKNNKSTFNYKIKYNQTNYMKIYKDIKNKIISNSNSNQKINLSNRSKNIKLNKIKKNQNSEKYIFSRNKNLAQQIKIDPKNNRTLTQETKTNNNKSSYSYDINICKSFNIKLKDKSNSIKKLRFDTVSFNSNSKEKKRNNINKNTKEKKFKIIEPKLNFNTVNKNIFSIKKRKNNKLKLKLDKIINNSSSSVNMKNNNSTKFNRKLISTPLEYLLNSYKSKNYKYSPNLFKKAIFTISPTYNSIFDSTFKTNYKNKKENILIKKYIPKRLEHSNISESKGLISSSMDKGKCLYNNKTIEQKNQIYCNNNTLPNLSISCINKKNRNNDKKNENKTEINYKYSLSNLFNKKDINSRNRIHNYLINSISSVNFTDNKNKKNIYNNNKYNNNIYNNNIYNNNLTNINFQDNKNIYKIKPQIIKSNKTYIKMDNIKNEEKSKKRIFLGIPKSNKKNIFKSSLNNKYIFNNGNKHKSSGYIGMQKQNKRDELENDYDKNINCSKKKIKEISNNKNNEMKKIYLGNNDVCAKTANSFNNNSKDVIEKYNIPNNKLKLSEIKKLIKNNSILDKKISLKKQYGLNIKRMESKNNININIKINNNNNIIYNKTINKKVNKINNSSANINKTEKIPLTINKELRISPSFTKNKVKNGYDSFNNNHSYFQKNKNYNKVINWKNAKVKFINIKFPKAKFINITNS